MSNATPFKWRHFEADFILLCVRWNLRYSLSYRDLEEMMQERCLQIDHTTIYRWVQRYASELEKCCQPVLATCPICLLKSADEGGSQHRVLISHRLFANSPNAANPARARQNQPAVN